ncbi:MAG: ATP-dependent DNA helicase RecG [Muribaculaceae bacterium]|nr:ATP-dependent DNA helicase RecG [Muribaculaceae bacterium]
MVTPDTDIKYLKGVGDARAKLLASELDIRTFGDLMTYFPSRHVDRSRFYHIRDLYGSEMPYIQIRGSFINFSQEGEGRKQRLVATFTDGDRLCQVVWFSKIHTIKSIYRPGVQYVLFGKPAFKFNAWQFVHPEIEAFDPGRPPCGFRGIYALTETLRKRGFTSRLMQTLTSNLMEQMNPDAIPETLPAEILREKNLMPLGEAIRTMHAPGSMPALQKAQERLKFEELFYLELHILEFSRKRNLQIAGNVFSKVGPLFNRFYSEVVPFPLTGAQKRVLREIREDMRTGRQMNRLLQGDVGSGKTLVAFMTMLLAVDNGMQAALMAPTEILATQHAESLEVWARPLGLNVALLTGSTRAARRREIAQGLTDGSIHILVGTHALIEDSVEFRNLGVAVIDEQHRFGVAQRARLWSKGKIAPHVLVMTATPIPRTLAMTVYGDLDVSVIDELPPGRKPIQTWLRYDDNRNEVYRHLWSELRKGRQAYIVYPLIQESEKSDLKSAEEGYERIRGLFPDVAVSLVHGRMKPAEKDFQMQRFVSGETRILVATTVIEVGVNVPNASVMIIENAERFGLSQLHQLRGRVGRGAELSYCILMSKHQIGPDTKKRLGIMTETTDGFLISEADLKLRGPGDMEGTQQSGIAFNLKVSNLARDGQILSVAREAAIRLLEGRILLMPEGIGIINNELRRRFSNTIDWSRIS